ncbi:hypothetical protein WAI453_010987 [Rhynchosporium graminicola]
MQIAVAPSHSAISVAWDYTFCSKVMYPCEFESRAKTSRSVLVYSKTFTAFLLGQNDSTIGGRDGCLSDTISTICRNLVVTYSKDSIRSCHILPVATSCARAAMKLSPRSASPRYHVVRNLFGPFPLIQKNDSYYSPQSSWKSAAEYFPLSLLTLGDFLSTSIRYILVYLSTQAFIHGPASQIWKARKNLGLVKLYRVTDKVKAAMAQLELVIRWSLTKLLFSLSLSWAAFGLFEMLSRPTRLCDVSLLWLIIMTMTSAQYMS